jgi:drug/metabolite transporter (DMT)-like permease
LVEAWHFLIFPYCILLNNLKKEREFSFMWFWFALIALLCWSGSDLFSKIGCQSSKDKYSHLKMVGAVGIVMGLHALYEILFQGVVITWGILLVYLPVSLLYIVSMAIGYLGLRYIELSISSPICNSSGALVAVLCLITGGIESVNGMQLLATALVCIGVIGLGVVEAREDESLRAARQEASNHRYAKSFLALLIPVIYCLLDALGTFADAKVLETLNEDSANCAYELTFLVVGLISLFYVLVIKRQKLVPRQEAPKYAGAICETIGQFFYIYALADSEHVALAAPIISAYCAASVIWSRVFLKEKLSWKHYGMILLVMAGIVILGIYDA